MSYSYKTLQRFAAGLVLGLALQPSFSLAGDYKQCKDAADKNPKLCEGGVIEKVNKANAAAGGLGKTCELKPGKAYGQFDQNTCANAQKDLNNVSVADLENAKAECEKNKKDCTEKCKPDPKDKEHKAEMEKLGKECSGKIEKAKKAADAGKAGNTKGANESGNTAEASKAQPAAMPPMTPPKDEEKEKEPEKTAQQPAAAATPETKKEEPKPAEGKSAFDQPKVAAPQSLNACSPTFAANCASGNTASCLSGMSAAQKQKITADCANTSALADPNVAKALTSSGGGLSPQSAQGNGSSGGGAMSGGGDTGAMLTPPKVLDEEAQKGKRDGSLNVDAGGGSGGDYGAGGSDTGSLFGDDPAVPGMAGGLGARGLASAFEQQTVDTSHSVVDRYGPSVFSIVDETLKNRCARNLHYHCRPEPRK